MNDQLLPLRQRRILNLLRNTPGYVTGNDLAGQLGVSARTIRTDVAEINRALEDSNVRIISKHSFGYRIEAESEDALKKLTQVSQSYLTREERIRHILIRLCLSEYPNNIDDLSDEMFVSRTTMEHDLMEFRKTYVLPEPHIGFIREKNTIAFEQDERKRRKLLVDLFLNNWDYNGSGNIFYQYQFLDERIVRICMKETSLFLDRFNLKLDDINLVCLNLMIAIAYYRIESGHDLKAPLKVRDPNSPEEFIPAEGFFAMEPAVSIPARKFADSLLDSLEEKLFVRFLPGEREEVILHTAVSILPDKDTVISAGLTSFFQAKTIEAADRYLNVLKDQYGISLENDEDFYFTLLTYLRTLSMPEHLLNTTGLSFDEIRTTYALEFELATAIQPLALREYGNYLNRDELLYLSFILAGALEKMNTNRLRTVILCHLNVPSTWNLKRQIEMLYGTKLNLTDLLSMYQKDSFDFSRTDLAITTTAKQIRDLAECPTLSLSPYFTLEDREKLDSFLLQDKLNRLCGNNLPGTMQALISADWHESLESDDYLKILDLLANDFIKKGIATEEFLQAILRRESVVSFASHPSFILVYASHPVKETHLSVATLKHRIKIGSYKIRTVIMAGVKESERTFLFKLLAELYNGDFDPDECRFMQKRSELLAFFSKYLLHEKVTGMTIDHI